MPRGHKQHKLSGSTLLPLDLFQQDVLPLTNGRHCPFCAFVIHLVLDAVLVHSQRQLVMTASMM